MNPLSLSAIGPPTQFQQAERFAAQRNQATKSGNSVLPPAQPSLGASSNSELRKAFDSFVGETFFGQMLSAMRKTTDKPAYFHGGRAEEVFQSQLDQVMVERIAEGSAATFTGPMFELFTLGRR